jgi:hypothetical protein
MRQQNSLAHHTHSHHISHSDIDDCLEHVQPA